MADLRKCAINKMKSVALNNIQKAENRKDGFFIPYKNYKNSPYLVSKIMDSMKGRVEKHFDPKKWGRNYYVTKWSDGMEITFKPSKVLLDAAKLKYGDMSPEEFRRNNDKPAYTRRGQESNNIDYGENLKSLINFKAKQRENIVQEVNRLQKKSKTNTDVEIATKIEREIKQLDEMRDKIDTQIKFLNDKEHMTFFKVINMDLDIIEEALNSNDLFDLTAVKDTIEFYKTFQEQFTNIEMTEKEKEFASEEELAVYNESLATNVKLDKFFAKGKNSVYNKKLEAKMIKLLSEDPEVAQKVNKTLDYLNKGYKNKKGRPDNEVKNLRKILAEEGLIDTSDSEITVENLLFRSEDIGWLSSLFATTTDAFDNIIPQTVMGMLDNYQNRELNYVSDLFDRLDEFNKKNPKFNHNELFNDKKELINIYTSAFGVALDNRNRYIRDYLNASSEVRRQKYRVLVNWYRGNTDVIDFRKLSSVKKSFEKDYPEAFTATDEQMKKYEQHIIDKVGQEQFEAIVESIHIELNKYDELKREFGDTNDPKQIQELLKRDVWTFIDRYFAKGTKEFEYIEKDGERMLYAGLFGGTETSAVQFIPKSTNTGYYSSEFKAIANDPKKYELWKIYKEMISYLNDTYQKNAYGTYALPLIKRDMGDQVSEILTTIKQSNLGKGKAALIRSVFDNVRGLYFSNLPDEKLPDQREIISNNLDTSQSDINDLAKVLRLNNTKLSYDRSIELAKEQLLPTYSNDIEKSLKASLISASLHQARLKIEPVAAMMNQTYKDIKTGKDRDQNERRRAVERFQAFLDKTVYNRIEGPTKKDGWGKSLSKTGIKGLQKVDKAISATKYLSWLNSSSISDKLKLLKGIKQDLKLFSPQEKIIIDEIEKGLNERRKKEGKEPVKFIDILYGNTKDLNESELQSIADSLGSELSFQSVVEGMLKGIIIKHLGFKPDSGLMNRMEGKINNLIEDLRGEYWTPGNIHVAHDVMTFSNIESTYRGAFKSVGVEVSGGKTMTIFRHLIERSGGLQDRKDELQKASKANTKESFITNAVFDWAVTKPEFKNQGAIMLAIMMDKTIIDNNGKEHPFFNKETGKFTAFEVDEIGTVKIKKDFQESFAFDEKTIDNKSNQNLLTDIAYQSQLSISAIQGNYSSIDNMRVKKTIGGRSAMLFLTWLPAQVLKRWGIHNIKGEIDINPATGKLKRDGIYTEVAKLSKSTAIGSGALNLALTYAAIPFTPLAAGVAVGASALTIAGATYTLRKVNQDEIAREAGRLGIIGTYILDILMKSATMPFKFLPLGVVSRYAVKADKAFDKKFQYDKRLSDAQVGALKALAQEFASKISLIIAKMSLGLLLYDEDDPEYSTKRRLHYFIQNLLYKNLSALNMYSKPDEILDQITEVSLFRDVAETLKILPFLMGEDASFGVGARNLLPLSTDILSYDKKRGFNLWKNPFLEESLFEQNPFINLTGDFKYIREFYKDMNSDGVYSGEKKVRKMRDELGYEVDLLFSDDLTRDELSVLKRAVKAERFKEKPENGKPEEVNEWAEKTNYETYVFEDFPEDYPEDADIEKFRKFADQKLKIKLVKEMLKDKELTKDNHEQLKKEAFKKAEKIIKKKNENF